MPDHYVITADTGHLRIYRERNDPEQITRALLPEQALDFPAGIASYTDENADMAGRFQGSRSQGRGAGTPTGRAGMSIDERLPLEREVERKRIRDVAEAIDRFLQSRPGSTWDFAGAQTLHRAVLDALTPEARSRLKRTVAKDLVNQPISALSRAFD